MSQFIIFCVYGVIACGAGFALGWTFKHEALVIKTKHLEDEVSSGLRLVAQLAKPDEDKYDLDLAFKAAGYDWPKLHAVPNSSSLFALNHDEPIFAELNRSNAEQDEAIALANEDRFGWDN